MENILLVRDCMNNHPIVIHAKDDYKNAFAVMQQHTFHHLPVVDEEDHLVGILAERDLMLAATHYMQCGVEVAEVMHRDVVTATPDMPLDAAARLMASHHIGGLPVIDGNHSLVGIITESDIFRCLDRHTH